MSIISLLQEYCQKEKLPLPKYTTSTYKDGPPHKPQHIVNLIFGNTEYSIDTPNVKQGKEILAQELFDSLLQSEKDNIVIPLRGESEIDCRKTLDENINLITKKLDLYNKVMFVDYENVNFVLSDINNEWLYVIVNAKNCNKPLFHKENVEHVVCPFVGKDVADTLLIYLTGKFNLNNKYTCIYTKDHYGDALARLIDGIHICSLDEIL